MEEPYGENPWTTELLQQLEPRTRDVDSEHSQQHEGVFVSLCVPGIGTLNLA